MSRALKRAGIALALLGVVTLSSAIYVVPQAQQALVVRLGRPIEVITEPGLRLKWPFIDTVTFYYSGLLALQPPTEPTILGDQKRVEVDTFTEFRIADALRFNQTVQTEEQARLQLAQLVSSSLRRELGQA
jgi:membrane protease subunit HflC